MSVKGKTIYHCSGSNRGKKFRTYASKKRARSAHKAIMAKKNKYTEALAS